MQTVDILTAGVENRATSKAVEAVVNGVARSRKAVLLVGAGISTNAGIPDFRSQGTGLYSSPSTSSCSTKPTLKGPELFSASVYRAPDTTAEHLSFIAAFKRSLSSITSSSSSSSHSRHQPITRTHDFMGILKKRGQLLRVYTQNIDGLEGVGTGLKAVPLEGVVPSSRLHAGISSISKGKGKAKNEGEYVQLHGSVHSVRCTGCDFVRVWAKEDDEAFSAGEVGACPRCDERATIRMARGQRSLSSLRRAFLRPSITLYDEAPVAALTIGSLSVADLSSSPDLMIVMGTSLRIPGFKKLVKEFAKAVKARGGLRVLVNREEVGGKAEWKDVFDYQVISDTDSFVSRILTDWKKTRPRDWVGEQKTLGQMFGNAVTKKSLADTTKPRKPLAARSTNLPNSSSASSNISSRSTNLPDSSCASSNISSLATRAIPEFSPSKLPKLPDACPYKSPPTSTKRAFPVLDDLPPPPKRSRLSECSTPQKVRSQFLLTTPTTQRTTRTALRAAASALPPSPSSASPSSPFALPRTPLSPPRLRSAPVPTSPSRSAPIASPSSSFYHPDPPETALQYKLANEFKPPAKNRGSRGVDRSSRVERTPSPSLQGVDSDGAHISPDLW
ncbi:hypothetical protein JCM11251_008019 [Rhodosporidiobolus azoricus]